MAEVDAAEAFGRAQRLGMRMAVVIEPTAFLEARGLDDEGVAFPLADWFNQLRNTGNAQFYR